MYKVNKIKEFRLRNNLNQSEVAKLLNLTQQQYSNLECGHSVLNAVQILTLCDLYEITPNDLLGIKGVHKVAISKTRE